MFHKEQQKNQSLTYTQYLKLKKQKEIKRIHKIQFESQKKQSQENIQKKIQQKCQKLCDNILKTVVNIKDQQKTQRKNWNKIDEKAIIVNGKLIYMEEQKPSLKNSDQLIQVLRNNKIKIKDYIYGDKEKILSKIYTNHENKKDEQVQKYINKNMREQNIIKTNHSTWYQMSKQNLFNSK